MMFYHLFVALIIKNKIILSMVRPCYEMPMVDNLCGKLGQPSIFRILLWKGCLVRGEARAAVAAENFLAAENCCRAILKSLSHIPWLDGSWLKFLVEGGMPQCPTAQELVVEKSGSWMRGVSNTILGFWVSLMID